jgi:hypothetical protein
VAIGLIVLVAALVRIPILLRVPMWWDEVWSMWQTQVGLSQSVAITPYDWPPLYFVVLWAWSSVLGHSDLSGRGLSLLFALASIVALYRAGRAIGGDWAGRFAALLFAVLPYPAYLSIEARGYALLLLLACVLAWVHVEWLRRAPWRRSFLYGIIAAACVYTSYTGILLVTLMLAHAMVATVHVPRGERQRHVGRVALVAGLIAVLLLPIASWLASIVELKWRHIVQGNIRPPGFDDLLRNYVRWVAGGQPVVLGAVGLLAGVGVVRWWRAHAGPDTARLSVLLLVWGVGVPIGMHLLRHQLHLTSSRYVAYSLPGVALLLGTGLGYLPRVGQWLAGIAILSYAVTPLPFELYRPPLRDEKPTRDVVRGLGERYRPGDAVLVDPGCRCGRPVEWAYWESIYYPGGQMLRVTNVAEAGRRLWHVASDIHTDTAVARMVGGGRVQTEAFGVPHVRGRLFERPPRPEGSPFGEALRFHGHDFGSSRPYRPGDTLTVRLWWSVATPPSDHVFELRVLAPGGESVATVAGNPVGPLAPARTSQWIPGRLYVDHRAIRLPTWLHAGFHTVRLVATPAADGGPASAASAPGGALVLGEIEVFSYN